MTKLAAVPQSRSPARAALADAISLVDKIREAIAGREAAKRSRPHDLAERSEQIAERLEELGTAPADPAPERPSNVDPRFDSGASFAFRASSEFDAPPRVSPAAGDRIQALIDGSSIPEDDLAAAEKEVAQLREERAEIEANEKRIERHNDRVEADLSELRQRLGYAERDAKRAADVVMRDEGGRDALIAAHARAVAIETLLRKAIEGAASPWITPGPKPEHSPGMVAYVANRDAKPCLWGTAAERLRKDPDTRIPTVAEALATLPDVAPPTAVGAGSSARDAA